MTLEKQEKFLKLTVDASNVEGIHIQTRQIFLVYRTSVITNLRLSYKMELAKSAQTTPILCLRVKFVASQIHATLVRQEKSY